MMALAVRLYLALTCRALPDFSDMARYSLLALEGGITISPPPGYPLFLRLIYTIFGAYNYQAVFIIQGIISAAMVIPVYWITNRIGKRSAALWAASITALYPNFLLYNLLTLTETLSIFFTVMLVVVLLAPFSETRKSLVTAILLIAGCVIRPVFLFFWPGILWGIKRKRVFIITTLVLLSPWIGYALATGAGSRRAARAFYKTYNPVSRGDKYIRIKDTPLYKSNLPSRVYMQEALNFIAHNKWKTLDIIYEKAAMIFARGWDQHCFQRLVGPSRGKIDLMIYIYIPVMLFGFSGMVILYSPRNRILALMVISYLSFFILLAMFKVRYRVLIEPLLIIYGSLLLTGGVKREAPEISGEGE